MANHLSRRSFLGCVGTCTVLAAMREERAHAAADRKPNIVFIMADDLGYGEVGCYGQKYIKTPCVDAMALEAIRFTDCHTGASVCAPSRCVLMTGLHTGHSTVRGNSGKNAPPHDGQAGRIPLKPTDVTVATVLKKAGYATGITGKWGLGEPGSTGLPNDHGFDEWLGYLNQDHAPHYFTDYLWHNKEKMVLEGNLDGKRTQYSHDVMADFALDFIRRHSEEPFFLYVPFCIPHADYEVPSLEPYEDEPWEERAKIQAAMITRMDRDVGRILDLVKELGLDENTIVFFCSDNGVPGGAAKLFGGQGPFRERKGSVYEGGTRTPMIMRWPGKTPKNVVSDAPWYFADILPTFAEIAGIEPPAGLDGISVLPTLLGKEQDLSDRFMYWEQIGGGNLQQAVRLGKWKAVKRGKENALELYALDTDIGENNDIAAKHPEIVGRFEEYLRTVRTESPYWPTS